MSFTEEEAAYLRSHVLARFATVDREGQPDVVPVAYEFDGSHFWVGGGKTVLATRKVRNVLDGARGVALVVDDMVSFEPFIARGVRIYGTADGPIERVGMVGPGHFLQITPTISWSWNLQGEPVGNAWYPTHRTVHRQGR